MAQDRTNSQPRDDRRVPALGRLVAVVAALGLASCSWIGIGGGGDGIEQKVDKVVWKSRDSYVRLESPDSLKGAAVAPNAHPVSLDPPQLYNALQRIRIQQPDKEGSVPLFSEWELEQLSINIAKALAEASPKQDVTFAIVGWHKDFLGLKQPKLTTGRVFYQGGQVNVIFGEAHRDAKDIDWALQEHKGDRRLDPYVPGMRSFTKRHDWRLVTEPGSGIYRPPGVKRSDWLVLTAQAFTVPPAAVAVQRGGQAPAAPAGGGPEVEQLRQEVERLRQDLQRMQGQSYYPPAAGQGQGQGQGYYPPAGAPAPAAEPPAPPTANGIAPKGPVQQRLIVLEDLRAKGLISEEEYQARRRQILSGL